MESSFGKHKVNNKGVAVPIGVRMIVAKVFPMGNDSNSDIGRKSVQVKRRKAGNADFRSNNAVPNVPDLRRESNFFQ